MNEVSPRIFKLGFHSFFSLIFEVEIFNVIKKEKIGNFGVKWTSSLGSERPPLNMKYKRKKTI